MVAVTSGVRQYCRVHLVLPCIFLFTGYTTTTVLQNRNKLYPPVCRNAKFVVLATVLQTEGQRATTSKRPHVHCLLPGTPRMTDSLTSLLRTLRVYENRHQNLHPPPPSRKSLQHFLHQVYGLACCPSCHRWNVDSCASRRASLNRPSKKRRLGVETPGNLP